ncbi:Ras GTPase activating protein ira2 [Malassezia cuniculi]|uniref:Ras GTPase activating protein ira2 n=1 Tax=Malassezia cuniculi TaxID=948313 RepID=A0AAF0J6D6_9BASI|nr:Ras GTPase activating protein ira2 [Malassezia cuniculi]
MALGALPGAGGAHATDIAIRAAAKLLAARLSVPFRRRFTILSNDQITASALRVLLSASEHNGDVVVEELLRIISQVSTASPHNRAHEILCLVRVLFSCISHRYHTAGSGESPPPLRAETVDRALTVVMDIMRKPAHTFDTILFHPASAWRLDAIVSRHGEQMRSFMGLPFGREDNVLREGDSVLLAEQPTIENVVAANNYDLYVLRIVDPLKSPALWLNGAEVHMDVRHWTTPADATNSEPHLLSTFLFRNCARIVYALSTTNWDRVHAVFATAVGRLNEDMLKYTPELCLAESSNLHLPQLAVVIRDVVSRAVAVKQGRLSLVGLLLRRVMLTWAHFHGDELSAWYTAGGGSLSEVFDTLLSIADIPRRRAVLWPALAALLPLCPEAVVALVQAKSRRDPSVQKKLALFEHIRAQLAGRSRYAIQSAVMLCRIASYTSVAPLHTLVGMLCEPLVSRTTDVLRAGAFGDAEGVLVSELVPALIRTGHHRAATDIAGSCIAVRSNIAGASVARAVSILASDQRFPDTWRAVLYPTCAPRLRGILRSAARAWREGEDASLSEVVIAVMQAAVLDEGLLYHSIEVPSDPEAEQLVLQSSVGTDVVLQRDSIAATVMAMIALTMRGPRYNQLAAHSCISKLATGNMFTARYFASLPPWTMPREKDAWERHYLLTLARVTSEREVVVATKGVFEANTDHDRRHYLEAVVHLVYRMHACSIPVATSSSSFDLQHAALILILTSAHEDILDMALTVTFASEANRKIVTVWFAEMCRQIIAHVRSHGTSSALPYMCSYLAGLEKLPPGVCIAWNRAYAEWLRLIPVASTKKDAQKQWSNYTQFLVAGARGSSAGAATDLALPSLVIEFSRQLAALLLGDSMPISENIMHSLHAHASAPIFIPLIDALNELLPASGPLPSLDTVTCVLTILDDYYSQIPDANKSNTAIPLFLRLLILLPINGDKTTIAPARIHACSVIAALLEANRLDNNDRAVVLRVVIVWIKVLDDAVREAAIPLLDGLTRDLPMIQEPCSAFEGDNNLPIDLSWGCYTVEALLEIGAHCIPNASVTPVVKALANVLLANDETLLREAESLLLSDTDAKRIVAMSALALVWPRHQEKEKRMTRVPLGPMEEIMEVMAADDFSAMLALCRVAKASEFDVLEHFVFYLMRRRGGVLPLIRALIAEEVASCDNPDMLMRTNNARVHLISTYIRQSSFFFVKGLVEAVIERLMSLPEDALNADPSQEDGGQAAHVSIMEFMDWLLNVTHSKLQYLSPLVRAVCRDLYVSVAKRFPDRYVPHRALNGLLMLRVVGPSLMNPGSLGVTMPTTRPTLQRELVLINKINLALGQGTLPAHKDENLQPLKSYIVDCMPLVVAGMQSVCRIGDEPVEGFEPCYIPSGAINAAYMHEHYREVYPFLLAHVEHLGPATETIRSLLKQIAPVSWSTRMSALENSGALQRMLQRQRASLDTNAYSHIFYPGPPRPHRVLHYVARHIFAQQVDLTLFIAHMQRHIVQVSTEPYDVLIDMTGAESEVFMSEAALAVFLASSTAAPYQNIRTVFFLNLTSAAFENVQHWGPSRESNPLLERVGSVMSGMRFAFGNTRKELEAALDPLAVVLSPFTERILDGQRELIGDVVIDGGEAPHIPVHLYIQDELLIAQSVRPRPTASGLPAYTSDIFVLSDLVVDAQDASTNILRLFQRSRGSAMWLYGNDVHHMAHMIRTAQWRTLSMSKRLATLYLCRRAHTDDSLLPLMIGASLWHLASPDPLLRTAAHELIASALGDTINAPDALRIHTPAVWMAAVRSQCDSGLAKLEPASACAIVRVLVDTVIQNAHRTHANDLVFLTEIVPLLARYAEVGHKAQVRRTMSDLLGLHVYHATLRPSMHRYVWPAVCKHAELNALLVSICIEYVPASPSPVLDGVLDVVAGTASSSMHSQLLAALRRTLSQPPPTFTAACFWHDVHAVAQLHAEFCAALDATYIRSLLPDIAWISLLLSHNESEVLCRAAQRSLTHAVYTLSGMEEFSRAEANRIQSLGRVLGNDDGQLFGNAGERDSRVLVHIVRTLLLATAPARSVYMQWRARLVSLATSTAFLSHSPLRPRGILMLGHLAEGVLDDDLVYQVLFALVSEMRTDQSSRNEAILDASLECLADFCALLPAASYFLPQLFWTGVVVAACEAPSRLAAAALRLAKAALEATSKWHADHGPVSFLLNSRSAYAAAAAKFDLDAGVSFDHSFSFALVTLLRGNSWGNLNVQVRELLVSVLQCAELDVVESNAELGILAALYLSKPCEKHLEELLTLARVTPETANLWRQNANVLCAPLVTDGTLAMLVALALSTGPYITTAAQVDTLCALIVYMCDARLELAQYLEGDARRCLEGLLERPGLDSESHARVLDTILCLVSSCGGSAKPGAATQYFVHIGFAALAHPKPISVRDAAVAMLVRLLDASLD